MGERNGVPEKIEQELEDVRRQIRSYDVGDRPSSPPARLYERERELMTEATAAARSSSGRTSFVDGLLNNIRREEERPNPMNGLEWGKRYSRRHDMGRGRVDVLIQEGGDVHLMVVDNDGRSADVEFCVAMTAGGRSPRVRNALVALAQAIRLSNEEDPEWTKPNPDLGRLPNPATLADGSTAYVGTIVFSPEGDERYIWREGDGDWSVESRANRSDTPQKTPASQCYPTKAAALAARR